MAESSLGLEQRLKKISIQILKKNKDLLWFHAFTLATWLILTLVSGYFWLEHIMQARTLSENLLMYWLFYIGLVFIYIFYEAAFIQCTYACLQEQKYSKWQAIVNACKQSEHLLLWTLFISHYTPIATLFRRYLFLIFKADNHPWIYSLHFVIFYIIQKQMNPFRAIQEISATFKQSHIPDFHQISNVLVLTLILLIFLQYSLSLTDFQGKETLKITLSCFFILLITINNVVDKVYATIIRTALYIHFFEQGHTNYFNDKDLETFIVYKSKSSHEI
jgi:hypothetical protein